MLEFNDREGRSMAVSEVDPAITYWIDDYAWAYLTIINDRVSPPLSFNSVEEAVAAANKLDKELVH